MEVCSGYLWVTQELTLQLVAMIWRQAEPSTNTSSDDPHWITQPTPSFVHREIEHEATNMGVFPEPHPPALQEYHPQNAASRTFDPIPNSTIPRHPQPLLPSPTPTDTPSLPVSATATMVSDLSLGFLPGTNANFLSPDEPSSIPPPVDATIAPWVSAQDDESVSLIYRLLSLPWIYPLPSPHHPQTPPSGSYLAKYHYLLSPRVEPADQKVSLPFPMFTVSPAGLVIPSVSTHLPPNHSTPLQAFLISTLTQNYENQSPLSISSPR